MKDDLAKIRKLQRRMNPQTLDALVAKGTNLKEPHQIINVFHVFTENDVPSLVNKLKYNSFSLPEEPQKLVDDDEGIEYWLIEAVKNTLLSRDNLDRLTDLCVDLASEFDAHYDGWYTKVVHVIQ